MFETMTETGASHAAQLDPVSSFFYGYSDYILFGFGLLMILIAVRKYVYPAIKKRYFNKG